MTAELIGWTDEQSLDHRRRMRNAMLVSLAIHGLVMALFAATPRPQFASFPEVLAVELVAAAPAPRAKPSAPPPEAARSAPAPPPVVKAPVQVLPEESPGRIRKAAPKPPEPKVVAKVKPEPEPVIRRPTREKALSYEDAMAALDDELGVDETADLLTPAPKKSEESTAQASRDQEARTGVAISPELAAWNLATRRLIQSKWVTPASYRGRGLATGLELRLSASGDLIGPPIVVQSSGDPFFDDNAVRALLTVAPLPPVAKPGRRLFIFRSEAD